MSPKILVAFDFDHTIIENNSDIHVQKLASNGLPPHIKQLYNINGWTKYMGAIFKLLHDDGVTSKAIFECMEEIELVADMEELFALLGDDRFENIIISDSNSVFIEHILKHTGYTDLFRAVYTNPAKFESSDLLTIDVYHDNNWCDLSTKNLCKGHILEEHIKARQAEGVTYSCVAYVGDGKNDYCPSLRLGENDVAFPRIGYALIKDIEKNRTLLKSDIVPWETASKIKETLEAKLAKT